MILQSHIDFLEDSLVAWQTLQDVIDYWKAQVALQDGRTRVIRSLVSMGELAQTNTNNGDYDDLLDDTTALIGRVYQDYIASLEPVEEPAE